MLFKTRILSSLEKVFFDKNTSNLDFSGLTAFGGETVSFQVAYYAEFHAKNVAVNLLSEISGIISIRKVGYVPCDYLGSSFDDNVITRMGGLFPDPLMPFDGHVNVLPGQWRAIWVTICIPPDFPPRCYDIKISFSGSGRGEGSKIDESVIFSLEVLPMNLPKQSLIRTEWFHADCLATYYKVESWSEAHWSLIKEYMRNAASHGMNMMLTPLWTPPLDTAVGGDRPTTQLLEIRKDGGKYCFDFSRLDRWVDMALNAGIGYFEMPHFFTQWGAEFTPKIMADEDGCEKRIFGWDVPALSPEYAKFISQLMPPLLDYFSSKKLDGKLYFHVSDEPDSSAMDGYAKAAALVKGLVNGAPIIDALSSIEFYKKGIIQNPIPGLNHIEPFLKAGIENLWVYYCCSQWDKVPNRFFHFPSARNRIIGALMFKYNIFGFLHWGYNFWYTQYSLDKNINPFLTTDAGQSFPGGDSFMVYPGEGGPLDSIRHEVFREALQDLRALRLLESIKGRDSALSILDNPSLSFANYPSSPEWILRLRKKIDETIAGKRFNIVR